MTEERKVVYIVTGGDNSSYHIERVFSTRADAERYSDSVPDTFVETYYVDDLNSIPYVRYGVYLQDDESGAKLGVFSYDTNIVTDQSENGSYKVLNADETYYQFTVVLDIHRATPDLAMKIVSEWYTQIKASHLDFKDWGIVTHGREVPI